MFTKKHFSVYNMTFHTKFWRMLRDDSLVLVFILRRLFILHHLESRVIVVGFTRKNKITDYFRPQQMFDDNHKREKIEINYCEITIKHKAQWYCHVKVTMLIEWRVFQATIFQTYSKIYRSSGDNFLCNVQYCTVPYTRILRTAHLPGIFYSGCHL